MKRNFACLSVGTALALSGQASPATAQAQATPAETAAGPVGDQQTQGGAPIEDIVVTAERRSSSVQSTPIAISAVSGDALRSQQVPDIASLSSKLPNVSFSRSGGDARVFIRGIGVDSVAPGSDPRVAIYTDGAYNARVQAALGSFFDIDRVEVLSGPQGTLYGRNATAGAINIISRDPGDVTDGYARLTIGDYSTVRSEGAIGGPLSDDIAVRVAFETSDRSGYGRNIATGQDVDDERTRAVRLKVKGRLGRLTAVVQGDYFYEDDHTGGYHFFGNAPGRTSFATTIGGVVPANPRDYAGPGPKTRTEAYGATATLGYDLGRLSLTSISAYKHLNSETLVSTDGSTLGATLLPIDILERSNTFTQELRLGGKIGILQLVAGGYFFHERNFAGNDVGINLAYFTGGQTNFLADGAVNRGTQETNAFALFTQNVVNILPKVGVDIGARFSSEHRSDVTINRFNLSQPYNPSIFFTPNPADVFFRGARTWTSFDPKIGAHYQASRELFLYASFSTGFKSGGFNVAYIQPAFDPERIDDYEAGIKADLLDRHLRVNLASFIYNYKNLQVNQTGGALGNMLITQNAARAKLTGAEMNVIARPINDVLLNLDVAYLHARFGSYVTGDPAGIYVGGVPLPNGRTANADGTYNLAGDPLSYAPDLRIHGAAAYTIHVGDLGITPRADVSYTSRSFHSAFELTYVSQAPFTLLDLFVNVELPSKGFSASVFVKNASDKFYRLSSTIGSNFLGSPIAGLNGPPRTFGASLEKRF